jgi:dihydroorotate dehydrogenase electron transfer subunit
MTELANPVLHRDQFFATVASNTPLCREHYKLVLRVDRFPLTDPGQFVQVSCRNEPPAEEIEHDWQPGQALTFSDPDLLAPQATLRRPFSLAGRRDIAGGVELDLIHRVVGIGTDWLSRLSPGDTVDVLGPLGNRFFLPKENETALLVGGGVGIPPMLYLATRLKGRNAVAFAGALTKDLLPLTLRNDAQFPIGEFAEHGVKSVITTDDGSVGTKGFVTHALEAYLDQNRSPAIIYTCGPEPMMKAVANISLARNIPCQIAVERAMACGMGTCQSCCIKVKKPDAAAPPLPGSDWCYRLACTDGPVFYATQLLW